MTLLDRFRTPSRDKHPDLAVRLAYVGELPLDDREAIGAMAREDDDPRVRKAAVAKLMAPEALAAIARDDRDESVRAQAAAMLRDIALEAFEDLGEADSLAAVQQTSDPKALAHIARTATRESVAALAASRLEDHHLLGTLARHAVVESVRLAAAQRVMDGGHHDEIMAIALNGDFKDTATAAVDILAARADLDHIVARGRNKSAVKRARTLIREAEERDARAAAEAAAAAAIEAELAVVEPIEDLASPPHGDPLAAQVSAVETAPEPPAESDEERQVRLEREAALAAEQAEAAAKAEAEAQAEQARRSERLTELAAQAAAAVSETDFAAARKQFSTVRREWRSLSGGAVPADLAAAFSAADAQMSAREQEAHEADARARAEALTRLTQLVTRVEGLAGQPELTLKAADRALRDVRAAMGSMPSLPTKQDFDDINQRFKDVVGLLVPKVAELREAEDWKRFANAAIQEQLCAKMEALKTGEDLEAVAREVRALQEQWRAAADVPRHQAEALWKRFKAAHDEVWARCEAYFAEQGQARAENLTRKVALCEQAEALADSTDWIQTAETIKGLQAEWKTIGPVSRGKEKAIWDRFRTACDRFFTRRHDDLAARKSTWADNLAKKDALTARAEALAESTDWDQAAAEIKKLQAEWKATGPVKKSKSEAIWQRFRGACDKFFARYAQRHDTARAERVAAREALCGELEALAGLDEAPADLQATVRSIRGRWQTEVASRAIDPATAAQLEQRLTTAFAALLAKFPAAFTGGELDPEANRKRMEALVRKAEDLAQSLAGGAKPAAEALSPTDRLAAMLKEALAKNTIGGKGEDESRLRIAAEELRQAQASWSRLGPVPDDVRRPLQERFQRAARTIADRVGKAARPDAPRGERSGAPFAGAGRGDSRPRRERS